MRDPRVDNLAQDPGRLLDQGGGGRHLPDRGPDAPPSRWSPRSTSRCCRRAAMPVVSLAFDGQQASYFKHASDAQLDWISPVPEWAAEEADCRIAIWADTNTRELSNVDPERQTRRRAATREPDGDDDEALLRGRASLGRDDVSDQRPRGRRRDEPRRLRGLLLPRLPRRRPGPARRLEARLGGVPPARRVDRGPRGGADRRRGHRPDARDRGPPLHPLRRRAQHARRRVLHRSDRGLGRGRGHVPPAGDDRRARGRRRAAARSRRARSSTRPPNAARNT